MRTSRDTQRVREPEQALEVDLYFPFMDMAIPVKDTIYRHMSTDNYAVLLYQLTVTRKGNNCFPY